MAYTQPLLAILGRPNVGKSTLFNRLVGRRIALVDDQPGVTRDRRYADASLADLRFRLIDTAGMEEAGPTALQTRMFEQTKAAMDEADILLFVIDARMGVTAIDEHFAKLLRRSNKKVILIANKAESSRANAASDVYSLGFEQIVLLSAEHGEGMGDLYDVLREAMEEAGLDGVDPADAVKKPKPKKVKIAKKVTAENPYEEPELSEKLADDKPMNLVILGRPNAGKSTLINALIGEERLLVARKRALHGTRFRCRLITTAKNSCCMTRRACANAPMYRAKSKSWQ